MADFPIGSWNQNDPEGLRDKSNQRKIETVIDNFGIEKELRPKISKLDVHSKSRQILRFESAYKPKNPRAPRTRKLSGDTITITANKLGKFPLSKKIT